MLCCPETREYLINYARSLIYTTAMGFPYLASIRAVYEVLSSGETEQLQQSLRNLNSHLRSLLTTLGSSSSHIELDHFPSSPIFSLRTPFPRQLAALCQEKGYIVRAIMSPTVPKGKERVRVCLHAGNTVGEIEGLVGVIGEWLAGLESRSRL